LKRNADDTAIVTVVQALGYEWESVREPRQDTMLARHIVSARRQIAVRWTTQNAWLTVHD